MEKKINTMEDLMQGIDSIAMEYDFKREKPDSLFTLAYSEEHVMHKIVGYDKNIAIALAEAMVHDETVKNVVFAAQRAYLDHITQELAPGLEPLIKHVEKVSNELSKVKEDVPRLDVSFKKRLS